MSCFLFSVDLEDVRDRVPNGSKYAPRVAEMTREYLSFLNRHGIKGTFFVEGRCAENDPNLVEEIASAGHELACHTQTHALLEHLGPDGLKRELESNLAVLARRGVTNIYGFRAPCFSLTEETSWAYAVLKEFGLSYSSSVLPARNPHHGWPGFGNKPRNINGVWEIPMTLLGLKVLAFPPGGGVYFRFMPQRLLRLLFLRAQARSLDITGYFHPYDIDFKQEKFKHPEVGECWWMNTLMYYGRKTVLEKLQMIIDLGIKIVPYRHFVSELNSSLPR